MAFEKSNQKMCKLRAIIWCIFVKNSVNPPSCEGKINDIMMDNVSVNYVMIAATFHWLLLAM